MLVRVAIVTMVTLTDCGEINILWCMDTGKRSCVNGTHRIKGAIAYHGQSCCLRLPCFMLLWSAFVYSTVLLTSIVSDILGDGTVHPWQLIRAPAWLKGYSGNELQRTARQLAWQGRFLREMLPTKYHNLVKNLNYQFKKLNRRQHARWGGGYKRFSRIDKPRLRYWRF